MICSEMGAVVVVVVLVREVPLVCGSQPGHQSQGFAELVPAVSTRGLPPESQRNRNEFEPASDPTRFPWCSGREDSGQCVGS